MDHLEALDDAVLSQLALDREQGVELVVAQAGGETDLVARHGHRGGAIGRSVVRDKMVREPDHHPLVVVLVDLRHFDQGGPAEALGAKESVDERLPRLAGKVLRIGIGKGERARHRPFAGLGGDLENLEVRGVETYGAWKPHGA